MPVRERRAVLELVNREIRIVVVLFGDEELQPPATELRFHRFPVFREVHADVVSAKCVCDSVVNLACYWIPFGRRITVCSLGAPGCILMSEIFSRSIIVAHGEFKMGPISNCR